MSVFTGGCKMNHISLAMMVLLILLNFQLVRGIWRYSTVMKNEELFTIRNPILLEFIDDKRDFMEWACSPGCSLSNNTQFVAYLNCHTEGFHWVQPLFHPQVPYHAIGRNIYVSKSSFTFAWYASIVSNSDGITKTMQIWVIDPEEASPDEIDKSAIFPSRHSYFLTINFFNLGQFPIVTLPSSTKKFYGKFQRQNGFWEVVLEWKRSYLTVGIGGQPISFQHRFIYEASLTFYWEPTEGPYDGTEIFCVGPMMMTILIKEPCAPHRALFMTRNSIRITSDAFYTTGHVMVYSNNRPPKGYLVFSNAALLDDGIILHMEDGLFWRSYETRFLEIREELPNIGVRGIIQRTTCLDDHPLQEVVDFGKVLFWTDYDLFIGGGRITSRRAGGTYKELLYQAPQDEIILTAAFGSDPNTVGILCTSTWNYHPILLILNFQTRQTHFSSFLSSEVSPENMPWGNLHMRFYESAKETLLLWNQTVLWYSFRDNNQWGMLNVPGFPSLASAVPPGESIHEVMLDQKWNLIVKMTNNQMFFCKFGVTELVWLEYWVRGGIPASLHTDQKNQVILVTEQYLGEYIHFELNPFPLKLETMGSMIDMTHHNCPYITFKHSMNNYGYHLDKGQKLLFWAQVVYPEGKGVNIQVLRSKAELLKFELSNDFEFIHKVFMVNMTIEIKQKMDYTLSENYTFDMDQSQGVVRVELVPNLIANRCDLPKKRVSYLRVGCPRNRHIRVARPWGMECDMHTFHNYTIPGFANDDDMVIYDWNNWGCVLKIHFQSVFKPALDLYDGDEFVKTVDANFVVSEMYGRTDFSYNTTMRQVGCLREAQTRDKMLKLPLQQTWGPGTYKTCFILESGVARNLNEPYEIMNRSSSNHLTFSQEDSAIYVFTVRILDPNYSFCDLKAIFAVQTYGISKPIYEHLIPYVTLSFSFISLCILGYSYYRYVKIFRELQERPKVKKT